MGIFSGIFKSRDAPTNRTAGNSYSQIIRNGKGEVIGLYPLMPDRMTVDRDEKGHLYYEYMVSSQPRALKMERRIPMRDKKKFWNWKNRKVLIQETNEEKEP